MSPKRPGRGAVIVVLLLDVLIGVGVGFGVYFANRKYGAPTAPVDVQAQAELCLPADCEQVTATVMLTWSPPQYGGVVTQYVVLRDGQEREELKPDTTEYVDAVLPGDKHEYEVLAVGDEGRGPLSAPVEAEVPIPPIEAARLDGQYRVVVELRKIDLLSKFYGIKGPSAGDTTVVIWMLKADCFANEGACDVSLYDEGKLRNDGRTYEGDVPAEAHCGKVKVRSRQDIEIRITQAKLEAGILYATAFEGTSTTKFACLGHEVDAVAIIAGTRE